MQKSPDVAKAHDKDANGYRISRDIGHALEIYTNKIIDKVFYEIKTVIIKEIKVFISTDGRLTKYDEKIYGYYQNLMNYYYKAIKLYRENKAYISNKSIQEILNGVILVIDSQLRQFDENHDAVKIMSNNKNPIQEEKEQIIKSEELAVFQAVSEMKKEFLEKNQDGIRMAVVECLLSEHINTVEAIKNNVMEHFAEALFQCYEKNLKGCVSSLNDLTQRKEVNFYYELLKDEKENLGSIIKIQVAALESEMSSNKSSEEQAVHKILSVLRESYQHLLQEITEIGDLFKNTEKVFSIETEKYEDFLIYMNNEFKIDNQQSEEMVLLEKKLQKELTNFVTGTDEIVNTFFNKELSSFNANKYIYEYKKKIAEECLMTEEIIESFGEVLKFGIENKEVLEETAFKDILNGIIETLGIKIENIKENKTYFIEESNQLMTFFNTVTTEITDEEKEAIKANVENWKEKQLFLKMNKEQKNIHINLRKELMDFLKGEAETLYQDKIEKHYKNQFDQIAKKIVSYKKDTLLFEMSTFEEILTYSVSRLRESSVEKVVAFVVCIDGVTEKLENILKKYSIELIKPKPHEMFNGKEHEVIVVEKNAEFKKGEIIKLMNSGYKNDNIVLLRANVIACK